METSFLKQLRSGQVPRTIDRYPLIGRAPLLEELDRELAAVQGGIGGFKLIVGPYGTGKSLLAEHVKRRALANGFVVAHLQLDDGFRLHRFEDVYYHIMHNLWMQGPREAQKVSLDRLIDRWILTIRQETDKREAHATINRLITRLHDLHPTFARAFLFLIKAKITGDSRTVRATSSWLSGDQTVPHEVKRQFEVKGGVDKHNALDFFKTFHHLVGAMGYSGFLLILDELDLVARKRSDLRSKALDNLRTLVDHAAGGQLPHHYSLLLGTPELMETIGESGALAQRLRPGGLGTVKGPTVSLDGFDLEEAEELTRVLLETYDLPTDRSATYRNMALLNLQKKGLPLRPVNPRCFITELLAVLDYLTLHPDRHPANYDLTLRIENEKLHFFHKNR